MPIKFPKGFARRKSAGNALEEAQIQAPAAEPSFRVFERPHRANHSFDSAVALKQQSESRRMSEDPYPDNIFAGIQRPSTDNAAQYNNNANSNHTKSPISSPAAAATSSTPATITTSPTTIPRDVNKPSSKPLFGKLTGSTASGATTKSGSTGKLYDSSSSAKFSSSSTLPSSTDTSAHEIPVPPIPESPFSFSIRASGRTFSFGSKASKATARGSTPTRLSESSHRERAMTSSTTSTATPPKLTESDFNLEGSGDLGNIFENFDRRKSQLMDSTSSSPPIGQPGPTLRPAPIVPQKDKPKNIISSLSPLNDHQNLATSPISSVDSQTSRDSLIVSRQDDYALQQQYSAQPENPKTSLDENKARWRKQPNTTTNGNAKDGYLTIRKPIDPEETSLFSSDKDFTHVPRNSKPQTRDQHAHDGTIAAGANLAARYEESARNEKPVNKVMTPAQFERYRQQQHLTRQLSNSSSGESSAGEESEGDEDEAEKRKQAMLQRKKQEAHLSVYRQQMMKFTGESTKQRTGLEESTISVTPSGESTITITEPPSASTIKPVMPTSISTPNLNLNRRSILDSAEAGPLTNGNGSDDEDIPLGILAAHGFPNRNRPPSQLAVSHSNPNLRASYHSFGQGAPSVVGEGIQKRSTLPVFARNLPRDPYYGSGLVNQTKRESLALGGGAPPAPASVYGGGPPPGLPPGGLVGVIANEERARALRRGSPNAQTGTYDGLPHFNFSNNPNNNLSAIGGGGLLGLGNMGGDRNSFLSPTDQSQIHVSQQMTQMMQMQMQWMQQMMQMQSAQLGQPGLSPMMGNPNFLQPPGPNQRPFSMVSNPTYGAPQVDHRTLSMLDPSTSSQWTNNRHSTFLPLPHETGAIPNFNGPPGYTPSIAPSERSNVGGASRYRPVSTLGPLSVGGNPQMMKDNRRSSTFTASTLRPWAEENNKPSLPTPSNQSKSHLSSATGSASTIRPVSSIFRGTSSPLIGGVRNASPADDDEDEEKAWADMVKNREKKKTGWKFKRGKSGLGDYVHPTEI
ncbi:hypothetical protein FQN57_004586 [Myotisia sp. PD_48]|nr:hypothetical protein FQN57_004586 [Myotisia sp. PD_48]